MALTRRLVKGSALNGVEHDANIDHFEQNPNGLYLPKSFDSGIKIYDANVGDADWSFEDLGGEITINGDANDPSRVLYQGNIKQWRFAVGNRYQVDFHLPHWYAKGTDIFIHAHWSHNSNAVTSGAVTWQAEAMYAKGHNQDFFSTPLLVNVGENASVVRYQHMITEVPLSAALGAGGLLATEDMEVDGLIIIDFSLLSNTMDGGALPFLHKVDLHIQSTEVGTKNRTPNFYL